MLLLDGRKSARIVRGSVLVQATHGVQVPQLLRGGVDSLSKEKQLHEVVRHWHPKTLWANRWIHSQSKSKGGSPRGSEPPIRRIARIMLNFSRDSQIAGIAGCTGRSVLLTSSSQCHCNVQPRCLWGMGNCMRGGCSCHLRHRCICRNHPPPRHVIPNCLALPYMSFYITVWSCVFCSDT